ncbi:uncharacterized protein LOC126570736 [Anopheles aquasalis]|uniref:uncharacterized protein LOC126570736 n=1 Tax=Anopheles aquasalis TaxID=42839 RepID=UPI00215A45FC|nr:uncharacterized protein LOC126570736 [Anopheles aquasalis]
MEMIDVEEECFEHGYAVKEQVEQLEQFGEQRWNSLIEMLYGMSNQITALGSQVTAMSTQINAIDNRLKKIEEQQQETAAAMHSEVKVLNSHITKLKGVLESIEIEPSETRVTPSLGSLISPAKCREDLDDLEAKAADEQFRYAVVNAASRIHGFNRKGEGNNICYQMVDYFFDRRFMTECSWSGRSRRVPEDDSLVQKIALSTYSNIIEMFFACVNISDDTFTLNQIETFFQQCVSHSKTRANAKKIRKSTARRRNAVKKIATVDSDMKAIVEKQLRTLQAML